MRKTCLLLLLALSLVAPASFAIACGPPPLPPEEVAAVRAYADTATSTTLQGLSKNNRAKYIEKANASFKAAVTQEVFDKAATQVNSQLGAYVSVEFLSTERSEEYTIVHYRAKYARGEVGVRMVFDRDHLVAGQWFE